METEENLAPDKGPEYLQQEVQGVIHFDHFLY